MQPNLFMIAALGGGGRVGGRKNYCMYVRSLGKQFLTNAWKYVPNDILTSTEGSGMPTTRPKTNMAEKATFLVGLFCNLYRISFWQSLCHLAAVSCRRC